MQIISNIVKIGPAGFALMLGADQYVTGLYTDSQDIYSSTYLLRILLSGVTKVLEKHLSGGTEDRLSVPVNKEAMKRSLRIRRVVS